MWGWRRYGDLFQLVRLKSKANTLRHISIFCLTLFIVLGCLVVAGCTQTSGKELYTTKLVYTATNTTVKSSSSAVTQLEARLGYFSSCLQIQTSNGKSSIACAANETQILLSDNNYFDQSLTSNADLFKFFVGTGKKFRLNCMEPYSMIVAMILSFACIVCFAFTSTTRAPLMYKYAAGFSYLAFILALVSSVWLETNITTANELMNRMSDSYYTLSAKRGYVDRGLSWTGIVLQFTASVVTGFLGIVGNEIDEIEEDEGIKDELN